MPTRKAKPFKPGDRLKHRFFAPGQPPEEVVEVLKENVQGLREEIAGLQRLGRGLLERQVTAHSRRRRRCWPRLTP